MTDAQVGAAVRHLRLRRHWTQADLGRAAAVSQAAISRIERGHFETLSLCTVRRVLAALDMTLEVKARWRGAELDRTLNATHNAMHEQVARTIGRLPGWESRAEISFSKWGERGVIDLLAWHQETRTLLVIELKSDLVDPGGLIAQVDRYQRLGPVVGRDIGWEATTASCWVVVADTVANRHRLADHRALLRGRFPTDGRSMRGWFADPKRRVQALSFLALPAWADHERRAQRKHGRPLSSASV